MVFGEHVLRLGQGTWMVGIRSKYVDSLDQRFSAGAQVFVRVSFQRFNSRNARESLSVTWRERLYIL